MQRSLQITIGYSLTDNSGLINEFTQDLPSTVEFHAFRETQYANLDGHIVHVAIKIVHAFSEGMLKHLGELFVADIVRRVAKYVKRQTAICSETGVKPNIVISVVNPKGEDKIKINDANDELNDKGLEELANVLLSEQNPTEGVVVHNIPLDESARTEEEVKEYLHKTREYNNANQMR